MKTDGTLLRTVDISSQGPGNELTGLAFNASGQLLASSNRGVVYSLELSLTASPAPTLDGDQQPRPKTAHQLTASKPSTNVAQSIELAGTNFTTSTQVVFSTRDNNGQTGTVAVAPTAVSGDGTRMQVIVPDLAETGPLSLAGGTGSVSLQVVPVITGLGGGWPGIDSPFSLFGSGFMEGASTITDRRHQLVDRYTNWVDGDVLGSRNSQFDLLAPLTVEGPITITTAGGSFTLAAAGLRLAAVRRVHRHQLGSRQRCACERAPALRPTPARRSRSSAAALPAARSSSSKRSMMPGIAGRLGSRRYGQQRWNAVHRDRADPRP